jgi:hypothetical protein
LSIGLSFDWDPENAARNLPAWVTGEAASVFADRLSLTVPDPRHSITKRGLRYWVFPLGVAYWL